MIKRDNIANFYNLAFLIAAFAMLLICNILFHKASQKIYQQQQTTLIDSFLQNLAIELEYGLSISDSNQLQAIIEPLQKNHQILAVEIKNNQDKTLASFGRISQDTTKDQKNRIIAKDIIQSSGQDLSELENIDSEVLAEVYQKKKLGNISLTLKPFDDQQADFKKYKSYLNISILFILLLLWLYVLSKQKNIQNIAKRLVLALENRQKPAQLPSLFKTKEGTMLNRAINKKIEQYQQLEHQYKALQNEISDARNEGNYELQEFIKFVLDKNLEINKKSLTFFYQSINQNSKQPATNVLAKEIMQMAIANYSHMAKTNNTLINSHYSGNKIEENIRINQTDLSNLFFTLVEQLIDICSQNTLQINLDQRSNVKESTLLRLSISSNSKNFESALHNQSLFSFTELDESASERNNFYLIAMKHLIRRLGGEYFYFKDELRIELPVTIIKNSDQEQNSKVVEPITSPVNCLVFDSDPIDKMITLGFLDKLNVNTDKATTKQVVLQKIRQEHFDLIIINSEFFNEQDPYFFGNLISEIQNHPQKTNVLLLSHDESVQEHPIYQKLEASFLKKPVSVKSLRDYIVRI